MFQCYIIMVGVVLRAHVIYTIIILEICSTQEENSGNNHSTYTNCVSGICTVNLYSEFSDFYCLTQQQVDAAPSSYMPLQNRNVVLLWGWRQTDFTAWERDNMMCAYYLSHPVLLCMHAIIRCQKPANVWENHLSSVCCGKKSLWLFCLRWFFGGATWIHWENWWWLQGRECYLYTLGLTSGTHTQTHTSFKYICLYFSCRSVYPVVTSQCPKDVSHQSFGELDQKEWSVWLFLQLLSPLPYIIHVL